MVSSVLVIYFYIARKGFNKTGANPVKRSVFHLSLHLLLMNLCFFFGQQVVYPKNYDIQGCLAVAILLQFTIVAFFLKTLFLAIVLVLGSLNKTAMLKFSSFKFEVIEFFVTYFVSFLMVLRAIGLVFAHFNLSSGSNIGQLLYPIPFLISSFGDW